MNKKIYKIIAVSLFCFLFFSINAFATVEETNINTQTQLEKPTGPGTSKDNPLVPCGGPGQQEECTVQDFFKLIQSGTNLTFMLAGFIVAIMFMYAGFLMITAAGNASQIQKARTIFKRVVIGFLIMFSAYLLVKNLLEKLDLNDGNDGVKSLFMNLIQ